jgi:uncharacterized membrane protein
VKAVGAVARYRHSNEEIKARLIFIVGISLAVAFVGTIFTLLYGLLFVVQPVGESAPNDIAAWEILKPMTLFITGGLSGMLASNGLKDKEHKP